MLYPDRIPMTLALDLEGTLISNAVSQIPRPGLRWFMEVAHGMFERVVVFTTVREPLFREIAARLAEESAVPSWFTSIEYVAWEGDIKDLAFVGPDPQLILLVDDYAGYIHPLQRFSWIEAPQFEHPYVADDAGLALVLERIVRRIRRLANADEQFPCQDPEIFYRLGSARADELATRPPHWLRAKRMNWPL